MDSKLDTHGMNGEYCYPSSHLLPDEVLNPRMLDGGDRGAGSMKADPRIRIDSSYNGPAGDLGLRLFGEGMNSIRRMSVFVSRQLRVDERTRLKIEVGQMLGAKRGSGVVLPSYGINL